MNKRGFALLILTLILTSILSFSLVQAQPDLSSIESGLDKVQSGANALNEAADNLADPNTRTEFLKNKWIDFIKSTPIGKVLETTSKIISPFNPLIKLIIGVSFSWTWAFWISFCVWLFFFAFFRKKVAPWLGNKMKIYYSSFFMLIGFLLASFIGALGLISLAVNRLILIPVFYWTSTNWGGSLFIQLFILALICAILIWFSITMRPTYDSTRLRDLREKLAAERAFNKLAKEQDRKEAEARKEMYKQKEEITVVEQATGTDKFKGMTPVERSNAIQAFRAGLEGVKALGEAMLEPEESRQARLKKTSLKKTMKLKKTKQLTPAMAFWDFLKSIFKP